MSEMPSINRVWQNATLTVPGLGNIEKVNSIPRNFIKGEIIIQEGDTTADSMYYIVDGHAEVYKALGKSNDSEKWLSS
jgi:CRP-like cAMP-binding protein